MSGGGSNSCNHAIFCDNGNNRITAALVNLKQDDHLGMKIRDLIMKNKGKLFDKKVGNKEVMHTASGATMIQPATIILI